MDTRKIQRLVGGIWLDVELKDLVEVGYIFRILESTGELVENDEGKLTWVVTKAFHINEHGHEVVEVKAIDPIVTAEDAGGVLRRVLGGLDK